MNQLKFPRISLFFASSSALVLLSVFVYNAVLPYRFPNQWQPTADNLNTTGGYDYSEEKGVFLGKQVTSSNFPDKPQVIDQVLGVTETSNKRIEVDLTNQKVYAYEGDVKVMEFLVSTGKWGRTPTGTFTIEYKTRAQKMSGGSKELGTYYYLPNVQFVQFFGNKQIPWSRGFSFHGTYWHNNFGTPMSHGCINMRNEDAEQLYYWTSPSVGDKRIVRSTNENPGTQVIIYGVAPSN